MTKLIEFTTEQKNLIWQRFVKPSGGTEEEAKHFIEVSETFGLNPLLNDIVFQRFNTKQGPRVNFITTRDGLLRVASNQQGYVGAPNANVVRQGDEFEFIPSKGEVYHKFGEERSEILGAYAVMHHEKFRPVAVFVDFEEYYQANSGLANGRYANVWDSMPSAMIIKIAEVFVLRRQFPLGGLYTREEMSLEEEQEGDQSQPTPVNEQPKQQSQEQQKPKEPNNEPKEQSINESQIKELKSIANEIANVAGVKPEKILNVLGKPIEEIPLAQFDDVKDKFIELKERAISKAEKEVSSQNTVEETTNTQNGDNLTLVKKEEGTSPNGTPFIKVFTEENNSPIFANTADVIEQLKSVNEGNSFNAEIGEENGFLFLKSVV